MLSHDLKSALSGITGGLQQIDSGKLDKHDRIQLERVMQESVILSGLLDTALEIDLASDAGGGNAGADCDLAAFLRGQSTRWRAQTEEKSIGWNLSLRPRLPDRLAVDELRLARIIGNVVNNAIKYTDAGSVGMMVETNSAGALEIAVSDDGPGFSDAALARMFEIYGRPEGSAKPGTGLGLHISKTLLDQVGGEISVRNRQAGGAQVRITFPAQLCTSATGQIQAGPRPRLPDLTGIRILLAEDNKTNQLVATQMLQSMNAEVTVASDGYEALQKFEKAHFDLALLDIEMPRMSGLDVLRTIRARKDARASTPLVALTAYAMREHKERIAAAGANGLIAKPLISIEDFGQALLAYLSIDSLPLPQGAAVAVPAGDALIDRRIYESLLVTIGEESMEELLGKVAEDVAAVKAGLAEGAAQADNHLIRANTHILISVAGAIGATALQALAERLNAAAHGAPVAALAEQAQQCIGAISAVEAFLGGEMTRLRQAP